MQRILVIRQHDMLGDFLLATPVLRALRSKFPNAQIAVLVRDYFLDALIHNPCVDDILVLQKSGNQWNLKHVRELMKKLFKKWDLTVVLNTVSHSLTSDLLAELSTRRYILGSEDRTFPGCSRNFFYNLLAPYSPHTKHQTERNLDIVRYLGADTEDLSLQMHLHPSELAAAREKLERLGMQRDRPVVAMHVGAGKLKNAWSVTRFAQLAQLLHDKYNAQIVLCWGTTESNLASEFCSSASFVPIKIVPSRLRELAAVFTQCDLLVCNDTGVMHVCAAVGVPFVAIFGPTDPAEWKPIGDSFIAVRGADGTVESVTVEQVYTQVNTIIQQMQTKEHIHSNASPYHSEGILPRENPRSRLRSTQ